MILVERFEDWCEKCHVCNDRFWYTLMYVHPFSHGFKSLLVLQRFLGCCPEKVSCSIQDNKNQVLLGGLMQLQMVHKDHVTKTVCPDTAYAASGGAWF